MPANKHYQTDLCHTVPPANSHHLMCTNTLHVVVRRRLPTTSRTYVQCPIGPSRFLQVRPGRQRRGSRQAPSTLGYASREGGVLRRQVAMPHACCKGPSLVNSRGLEAHGVGSVGAGSACIGSRGHSWKAGRLGTHQCDLFCLTRRLSPRHSNTAKSECRHCHNVGHAGGGGAGARGRVPPQQICWYHL